jgi:asparagine synthase (glutamine-hydrolysing)
VTVVRLTLRHNAGYRWQELGVSQGKLYYKGNNWEIGRTLGEWIRDDGENTERLLKLLEKSPHAFAIVLQKESFVLAAVDQLRTHPLFYRLQNGAVHVTDEPYAPELELSRQPNALVPRAEFELSGYVGMDSTLSSGLQSLAACHYLHATSDGNQPQLAVNTYRQPIESAASISGDSPEVGTRLRDVSDEIFSELCEGIKGRQAIIPLSSGVDSRFIAAMLKRHGHSDVVTFTYGRPGNWEQDSSRKTAEHLEYPWHFVPYSRPMWRQRFESSPMRAYLPFAGRHVSTPHVQDWPAVAHLKEEGIISDDAIFIPGQTCILISNRLEPSILANPDSAWSRLLACSLFKHHFMLQRVGRVTHKPQAIVDRIVQSLPEMYHSDPHALLNAYFNFEATQRHGKMLINSVRVYEFWGHQWSLPLWDGRLIKTWAMVDYAGRYSKSAFREFVYRENFYNLFPRPPKSSAYQRMREAIKQTPALFRPLKLVKCLEERLFGYFHNYLEWYGIVSYPQYVYHMGRCGDVYSLLSRLYLRMLVDTE